HAELAAFAAVANRRWRQRTQGEIAPASQERRLRVELYVEQVGGREPFSGHEPIADDARPRADLVVAEAEHVQHVAVHDAGVRRPEASALRIAHAWILRRAQPAPPPARTVGPRLRQPAVESDATRNGSIDGPADMSLRVGDDEVLSGSAKSVHRLKGLVHG